MERRFELAQLHRGYVPPAGLHLSRPRDVRLSAGGRFVFGLAMLFFAGAIAAAVGMSFEASSQAARNQAIETTGVDTIGTVIGLTRRKDEKKAGIVIYRFEANGREYRRQTDLSLARWRTLSVGSPIGVRYAASIPDFNVLQGAKLNAMPRVLPFVVGVAIASLGLVFLAALHRQRQMLSDGRVAPARVTGHTSHQSGHSKHRAMTYEFTVLSGAMETGKAGTSAKPPSIGSVICVIYDPEKPKRNRPYPFELVRPA